MSDEQALLDVVCLCAEWCGTCREYKATFADLKAALPGHRYRWIDIEDESDLVGDIDVETFPTLMVAHQGHVLFAGPVLPGMGAAQRLVEAQEARAKVGARPALGTLGLPLDQAEAYQVLAEKL